MNQLKGRRLLLVVAVLLIFPLFFYGGPDYDSSRSFRSLWNFGHFIFFALATMLLLNSSKKIASMRFQSHVLLALAFTFIAGISIELLQYSVQRDPDWIDVGRNVSGGLFAVFWFSSARHSVQGGILLGGRLLVLSLVTLQLYSFVSLAYDEWLSDRDFPVLADFETQRELRRWRGNASMSLVDVVNFSGEHSLKIDLGTEKYSGIALAYFPGNWQLYKRLFMAVYNPDDIPLDMVVRIHDVQHTQSEQLYSDRFNKTFKLVTGWNEIAIDLAEVIAAPQTRAMDPKMIAGLGLFVVDQPEPRTLYLDGLKLDGCNNIHK